MPGIITVPEFIRETREDFTSPTTSTFVNRIPQCRETVNKIDEVGVNNGDIKNVMTCVQCWKLVQLYCRNAMINIDIENSHTWNMNSFKFQHY